MNSHPTQSCTISTSPSPFREPIYSSEICRLKPGLHAWIFASVMCVLILLLVSPAQAQAIRFRMGQVRVTVPINSGNSTTITNQVNLTGVTNADLSVSGLPPGASAVITDTNGAVVTTVTTDTNLWLTVNTTNIAEGIYTFSLNASGQDTNGAPVANDVLLVLQAAYIWKGANGTALGVSNAWSA